MDFFSVTLSVTLCLFIEELWALIFKDIAGMCKLIVVIVLLIFGVTVCVLRGSLFSINMTLYFFPQSLCYGKSSLQIMFPVFSLHLLGLM